MSIWTLVQQPYNGDPYFIFSSKMQYSEAIMMGASGSDAGSSLDFICFGSKVKQHLVVRNSHLLQSYRKSI
jgi:hypothetical protein